MISVSHIDKSFGQHLAVKDLSFTIKEGEIVGLLGPNGAGKTTTMRMITGFLSPDKGTITVNDINVLDEPEKAQRIIGYLPENNPLYKDMLVSEFLELSSALANQTAAEKTEALAFVVKAVNLENVFYRPLSELSKGYKQRVGIAAALITNPRVLVLDEPTEGLDPNQRSEVRSLIKKLSKKHTIIISTHVMQEVTAMCERILIINNGSLVADGTPDSLSSKQQPAIHLDLEGKDILESIKAIKKIDNITSEKKAKDRFHITLHANNNDVLYQTLSGLIQKKKWIVREMRTESADLEQIFHQLTMGENQLHSTKDAQ